MIVVYVDVLFLVNFGMNVLALTLLSYLISLPQPWYRILAAASVGALGAVGLLYLAVRFSFGNVVYIGLCIGTMLLMCRIAFPSNEKKQLFMQTLGLLFAGFVLQGMSLWCYQNTMLGVMLRKMIGACLEWSSGAVTGAGEMSLSLISLLLVLFFLWLVCRIRRDICGTKRHEIIYKVRLYHGKKRYEIRALVDSGNCLRTSQGKWVHVLELDCLMAFLPELGQACRGLLEGKEPSLLEQRWLEQFHAQYLPYHSIKGEGTMLMITLQRIEVARGLGLLKRQDCVFALTPEVLSAEGAYTCILNQGCLS